MWGESAENEVREKLVKKLQNAFKLGGFNVRRELCNIIVDNVNNLKDQPKLNEKTGFEYWITKLCTALENQCSAGQSIEKQHINKVLEVCLNSVSESSEKVFSVINAFDFPKLQYDPDRKQYMLSKKKSKLLSEASTKPLLFIERYQTILQRTKRNFLKCADNDEKQKLKLQTVDYLLTLSNVSLTKTMILGSIIQLSFGKYHLEDPTGIVELNLSHAKFGGGFFVENSFVLVNGLYEDKILNVSSMILPRGEPYLESRPSFSNINYFGGLTKIPLRDSENLKEYAKRNAEDFMLFFSDVWLDHPMTFEKLEVLFEGFQNDPPIAFIFLGNFISESHGSERNETLKKYFKQLGTLLSSYQNLLNTSQFVFIPGTTDPSTPHIVPRLPIPPYITEHFTKQVSRAIFATNPCRIQYCHREITVFRSDILAKMLQGTLSKPKKENIPDFITRTIISQGHLVPLSLNAQPVHWDFDYTLRLHPLPDLVVIGDKSNSYQGLHDGCMVVNPGPFCETGFEFITYNPYKNEADFCAL